MRAKDYRIGNLVEYDGRIFEIHTITETYPTLNTSEFGIGVVEWYNIKPIKITEKCFIKDKTDLLINKYNFIANGYNFSIDLITYELSFDFGNYKGVAVIKYVHELQNLFYTLTKEELKINLV